MVILRLCIFLDRIGIRIFNLTIYPSWLNLAFLAKFFFYNTTNLIDVMEGKKVLYKIYHHDMTNVYNGPIFIVGPTFVLVRRLYHFEQNISGPTFVLVRRLYRPTFVRPTFVRPAFVRPGFVRPTYVLVPLFFNFYH